jgi:PAS domain S-box-containing protein
MNGKALADRLALAPAGAWGWPEAPAARAAAGAALVALAYYVGAQIGFAYRAPSAPISILWLPNSILLAALIVSPLGRWPWLLLGGVPAHLLVAWQTGAPLLTLSLLYLTNAADAIIGALLVRFFVGGTLRFDTLRSTVSFLVGAVVATVLVSFADSFIVVATGWGADYWASFLTRVRSNTLTHLMLVPPVVVLVNAGVERLRSARWLRYVEWLALMAAIVVVSLVIFHPRVGPANFPASVYVPLPLLLTAAVRFGVGTTAFGVLLMAAVSGWNVVEGHGPFVIESAETNLVALQTFLLAVCVPLLCLGSLVQERQRALLALRASERQARARFAQLAALYRTAPIGLAFVDTDLRYVAINDRMAEINGFPAAEHPGRPVRESMPEIGGMVEALVQRVLESGNPIQNVEIYSDATARDRARVWSASYFPVTDDEGVIIGANAVVQEVTDRKRAENAFRYIAEGVSATTGELFFRSLVEHLATAVGANYAFVGQLAGARKDQCWTIAAWNDGSIGENFQYELENTPCAEVVKQGPCVYPEGVRAAFPSDTLLAEMGVESYLGTPLRDSSGEPLGLLVVLGREPLSDIPTAQALLQIFAARASAELERKHDEEALRRAYDSLAKMHTSLRGSEERYREVVETQTELVCRFLPDSTLTFVNEAYCRYFDQPREALIGRRFLELIPEHARALAMQQLAELNGLRHSMMHEHEVLLPDGSLAWQQWVNHVILSPDGDILEFQGIGRDVTARRHAEDALRRSEAALRASYEQIRNLAGRLITAQESERTRIARELHDDVNQQLAALSIAMSGLRRRAAGFDTAIHEELGRLQQRTIELADTIRAISHDLHPGVLEHAGLVAAIEARCTEFGRQHAIDTTFQVPAQLGAVPPEIALCLYRVTQEALRNIAAHARAERVHVALASGEDALTLTITDNGSGFDAAQARFLGGLGLISLDERVRLVNGTLSIDTGRGRGTSIRVEVPLRMSHPPARPASAARAQ